MSSIPKNKAELYSAIEQGFKKILVDYQKVPDDMARIEAIEGNVKGSKISVNDTLAYLIGWGELVLKWHRKRKAGEHVDFPETGYKWNELGRLAQSFHQQYQTWTKAELIAQFVATTERLLKLVASLDNQVLYGETWYEKYTLGKMIQFNTSSPLKNMRTKVRKFNKQHEVSN